MRSLGEFFGHIIKGAKTSPKAPRRTILREDVQEESRADGRVRLRRTIIEEIEVADPADIPKQKPTR